MCSKPLSTKLLFYMCPIQSYSRGSSLCTRWPFSVFIPELILISDDLMGVATTLISSTLARALQCRPLMLIRSPLLEHQCIPKVLIIFLRILETARIWRRDLGSMRAAPISMPQPGAMVWTVKCKLGMTLFGNEKKRSVFLRLRKNSPQPSSANNKIKGLHEVYAYPTADRVQFV